MTKLPNSYEEAQEILKSKPSRRRSPILRTIIITVLSLLVVFLVWVFYPLPAPNFAIRSLLPAKTAISVESHNPSELWNKVKNDKYIESLYEKPIWSALEREYQKNHKNTLKKDTNEVIKEINKKAGEIIGMRNILAFAGGVSYSEDGRENLHSIIWLDNVGFLALKIALYTTTQEVYKDIKYLKVQMSPSQNLYIAPSPAYPRALLVTTDLKSLSEFRIPPERYLDTEFDSTEDIVEANVYPKYLPKNIGRETPPITGGEILIRWSTSITTSKGSIEFSDNTIPSEYLENSPKQGFIVKNTRPSLILNLRLPNKLLSNAINNFLSSTTKSTNPMLKPLLTGIDSAFTNELEKQVSFMLTEQISSSENIFENSRIFIGVKDAETSQKVLDSDLEKILESYSKSNDPTLRMFVTQIGVKSEGNTTSINIPMLPKVSASFSKLKDISYTELKVDGLPDYKPEVDTNEKQILGSSLFWNYSQMLSSSLVSSIPQSLENETIVTFNSNNSIQVQDILSFLSSSEFFSLSFAINSDNSNLIDIDLIHSFTK